MTEEVVLDVSTTEEWEDAIANLGSPATNPEPFEVSSGSVRQLQSAYFLEGERFDGADDSFFGNEYSDEEAAEVIGSIEGEFTNESRFPEWGLALRNHSDEAGFGPADYEITLVADDFESANVDYTATGGSPSWDEIFSTSSSGLRVGLVEIFVVEEGFDDRMILDAVAVYDTTRTKSIFDFDDSTDSNGYLEDPPLYTSEVEVELEEIPTADEVTDVEIESSWNDTSNEQRIEITSGDETKVLSNTSTGSVSFDDPEEDIEISLILSGYGSRTTDTPTQNHLGQQVDSLTVTAILLRELDGAVQGRDADGGSVTAQRTRMGSLAPATDADRGVETVGLRSRDSQIGCEDKDESSLRGIGPNFILGRTAGGDNDAGSPKLLRVFVPGSITPGQDREGTSIRRVLSTRDFILRFESIKDNS